MQIIKLRSLTLKNGNTVTNERPVLTFKTNGYWNVFKGRNQQSTKRLEQVGMCPAILASLEIDYFTLTADFKHLKVSFYLLSLLESNY